MPGARLHLLGDVLEVHHRRVEPPRRRLEVAEEAIEPRALVGVEEDPVGDAVVLGDPVEEDVQVVHGTLEVFGELASPRGRVAASTFSIAFLAFSENLLDTREHVARLLRSRARHPPAAGRIGVGTLSSIILSPRSPLLDARDGPLANATGLGLHDREADVDARVRRVGGVRDARHRADVDPSQRTGAPGLRPATSSKPRDNSTFGCQSVLALPDEEDGEHREHEPDEDEDPDFEFRHGQSHSSAPV